MRWNKMTIFLFVLYLFAVAYLFESIKEDYEAGKVEPKPYMKCDDMEKDLYRPC